MNSFATLKSHGELTEPATLRIQRRLPGPIERVWSYLTESDLRRQWLAAGSIENSAIELVWRNSELTDPPGTRPDGFGEEHRMNVRVLAFEPPRKLVISWGEKGEVCFELETIRDDVLLTLTHKRLPDDPNTRLNVRAGWHAHLDMLVHRVSGTQPVAFWDHWGSLRKEYEAQ